MHPCLVLTSLLLVCFAVAYTNGTAAMVEESAGRRDVRLAAERRASRRVGGSDLSYSRRSSYDDESRERRQEQRRRSTDASSLSRRSLDDVRRIDDSRSRRETRLLADDGKAADYERDSRRRNIAADDASRRPDAASRRRDSRSMMREDARRRDIQMMRSNERSSRYNVLAESQNTWTAAKFGISALSAAVMIAHILQQNLRSDKLSESW